MKWYRGNRIYLRRLNNFLHLLGIQIKKTKSLVNLGKYISDIYKFRQNGGKIRNLYPVLEDYYADAGGNIKNHLFHSDLLTSQYVFENKPENHLDVGSRIDGLVAQIAAFRKLDVFDVRNADLDPHKNINFIKVDLLREQSQKLKLKYDSISSIGCLAHIGLGRYGEEINPNGHLEGIKKVSELAKSKCMIYVLAPVGKSGVEFNAHRVFNPKEFSNYFKEVGCDLRYFHLINDYGDLKLNSNLEDAENLNFGGGYYVFEKK